MLSEVTEINCFLRTPLMLWHRWWGNQANLRHLWLQCFQTTHFPKDITLGHLLFLVCWTESQAGMSILNSSIFHKIPNYQKVLPTFSLNISFILDVDERNKGKRTGNFQHSEMLNYAIISFSLKQWDVFNLVAIWRWFSISFYQFYSATASNHKVEKWAWVGKWQVQVWLRNGKAYI